MKKIFWIGSHFFQAELKQCGWEVHFFNFTDVAVFGWNDLVRMAGWEPDMVVVADKSRTPFVLGMEDFPCLTVFYAVDTHIHSWYPLYAQGFDVCLISLRDHKDLFLHKRLTEQRLFWFPPFARDADKPLPHMPKKWDCLFVGTVDANITPQRMQFLQSLKARVSGLHVMRGAYHTLFSQGKVIFNYCEMGDLNFRVFEALGCGSCLVTPLVQHGLTTLFKDGEELVTYAVDDIDDATRKIDALLQDKERREGIAAQGLAAVDAAHRAMHRARTFTDICTQLWQEDVPALIQARRANAQNIRQRYLRMPYLLLADTIPSPFLQRAYVQAAKGAFA